MKGRIDLCCSEAAAFIDAQAAALKEQDGFNLPVGSIRNILTRGDHCLCAVARRLLDGE